MDNLSPQSLPQPHRPNDKPSAWVERFAPLIPAGGTVLDLACGAGRHARFLASLGYAVEAVDQDAEALASLDGAPGITARQANLEGGPWPYYGRIFEGIVATNYLFRPLIPLLANALGEGGIVIYETFMAGNERFGKPSNPAHLLREGELLDLLGKRFTVVAFEQGEVSRPWPAVVQRICVRRGKAVSLPESV